MCIKSCWKLYFLLCIHCERHIKNITWPPYHGYFKKNSTPLLLHPPTNRSTRVRTNLNQSFLNKRKSLIEETMVEEEKHSIELKSHISDDWCIYLWITQMPYFGSISKIDCSCRQNCCCLNKFGSGLSKISNLASDRVIFLSSREIVKHNARCIPRCWLALDHDYDELCLIE